MKKELLVVVFAFDKFRQYLIQSRVIIFTDHLALRYLMSNDDAKPRLILWILLLQEFNVEIKDKRDAENLVADHLSWFEGAKENQSKRHEINGSFPKEHLCKVQKVVGLEIPWFVDFSKYFSGRILPKSFNFQQKMKSFAYLKNYFWEDPYLFRVYADQVV